MKKMSIACVKNEYRNKKNKSTVALPSFQSRVHSVLTTLKTPRKKMSANPYANILYSKNYIMHSPIFASIILLLPTHTQDNAGGNIRKTKTQFLPECKPHAQKLLTQFLKHLPTHHPEIEVNRILPPKLTKSEILKEAAERKEARMAWHYIQRAVWRNGWCSSLESTTKQQVTRLVASVGSPPLRKAATTLEAMAGHVGSQKINFQ